MKSPAWLQAFLRQSATSSGQPAQLIESLKLPTIFIACAWIVEIFEHVAGINLNFLGIYPREFTGLFGIVAAPFLHGGFSHLLSNTFTFLLLGASVIFFFPGIAYRVFGLSYLLTGIGVWLMARPSYHIGASGLVYAFAAFLFSSGVFRKKPRYMVISLIVALLYGSLLYGIMPGNEGVSWESHLIGALVGVYCAYQFRNYRTDDELAEEEEEEHTPHGDLSEKEGFIPLENEHFRYTYREK